MVCISLLVVNCIRRRRSSFMKMFFVISSCQSVFLANPFTISELQKPSYDVPELHKIRRSPDFDALKLWKFSSGRCLSAQFHTFVASRTGYRQILLGSGMSCDRFEISKVGKGSIGCFSTPHFTLVWLQSQKNTQTNLTSFLSDLQFIGIKY